MVLAGITAALASAVFNLQPLPAAPAEARAAPAVAYADEAPAWTQIQFANNAARATPPRWSPRGEVCVGVTGLGAEQAQFLSDRVSHRAQLIGLNVGRPGCASNLFIFFTNNPSQVARDILRNRDYSGRGRARAGDLQSADDFADGRRPIRWWYVWQSVGADGQVASHDDRGAQGGPVNMRAPERGRLGRNTRQEFRNVFVIVDGSQIGSTNVNAVADYISMVALTQQSFDTPTDGSPSVLGLFRDSTPQTELTSWDLGQLREYYRTPQ